MSRAGARITQADVARAKSEGKTFIYFLRAGDFVKIGRSKNWRYRMAGMQVGSPYTIVPLLVLIGDQREEQKLHRRFRASHFRGEWFHLGPAIREYIKESLSLCVAKADVSDLRTPNKWEDSKEEIIL
jgi:hypothetical protein